MLAQLIREAARTDPDAGQAAVIARLDKKNTQSGRVTLTLPFAKGEYRLREMEEGEYERELVRIGRSLC